MEGINIACLFVCLIHIIMDASPRPPSDGSPVPVPPASKYIGSSTNFLKGVVEKRVIVRLTSGVDYQGRS